MAVAGCDGAVWDGPRAWVRAADRSDPTSGLADRREVKRSNTPGERFHDVLVPEILFDDVRRLSAAAVVGDVNGHRLFGQLLHQVTLIGI